MTGVVVTGRADLTDAQWAVLEPLPPVGSKTGRPAEMEQAAAHRWDSVADTGGRTVA